MARRGVACREGRAVRAPPAPTMKAKRILLLLEWYDYRFHLGVAKVASEAGWQLHYHKDWSNREGFLEDWKGDGCIALLQCTDTLQYFRTYRIPLVDLGLGQHNLSIPRVSPDNREVGRFAAEHFRDRGYREVFVLKTGGLRMYEERLSALREFMKRGGGSVHELETAETMGPGVIRELRAMAAKRGRRLEELSVGFFAYQDEMGAALISLCLQHRLRVPENVAVLSVDNDELINTGLRVGLSSIDTDIEGQGCLAANVLRSLLATSPARGQKKILRHPPKGLVVRASTDCYAVGHPLVAEALHWIHNHYQSGITAADVAEAMRISQQGLQKAFAIHYSRSPGQEIRHQRTQMAGQLLVSSSVKIQDIAKACGFYSVDNLIRTFRQVHGVTPGKYRSRKKAAA